MLAKIPATSIPQLKKWATLAKLARAQELKIIADEKALRFAVRSAGQTVAQNLYGALTLEAEVTDTGCLLIAPSLFLEAIGSLEGSECVIAFDGIELSLSDQKCYFSLRALAQVENADATMIPFVDGADPTDWSVKLSGKDFRKTLDRGSVCASTKLAHMNLWQGCVHIEVHGNRLGFEASDGFTLSRSFVETEAQGEGDAVMVARFAETIARLLPDDEVTVKRQGKVLTFEGKGIFIQVGLSGEKYPDTSRIAAPYKDNAATAVVVNTADLKALAERITAFCEGDTASDRLVLSISPEGVKTHFKNASVGFFENTLEAEVKGEALDLYLGAGMVRGILGVMGSEKVNLYVASSTSPVRFEPAVESPKEAYLLAPRTTPVRAPEAGKDAAVS